MRRKIIKKLFLFLLFFTTSSVWAEWIKVTENNAETVAYYIDLNTLRKDGYLRKIWEISDYKMREAEGHLSVRLRSEYDCKNERVRTISYTTHSENMAHGNIILSSNSIIDWRDIAPSTVGEAMLKIVCAK